MLPVGALLIFLPVLKLMKIWQGSFWVWGATLCNFYDMSQANNVDFFGLPKRYSASILPSCINITVLKASIHY